MMIPPEVRALIDRARAMQATHEACERTGGHYFFGTGPSKILYPEWDFPPGEVVRQVFAGTLPPGAVYSGPWFCSRCRRCASQEEARQYMQTKPQNAAYFHSRLWC